MCPQRYKTAAIHASGTWTGNHKALSGVLLIQTKLIIDVDEKSKCFCDVNHNFKEWHPCVILLFPYGSILRKDYITTILIYCYSNVLQIDKRRCNIWRSACIGRVSWLLLLNKWMILVSLVYINCTILYTWHTPIICVADYNIRQPDCIEIGSKPKQWAIFAKIYSIEASIICTTCTDYAVHVVQIILKAGWSAYLFCWIFLLTGLWY